MEKAPHRANGRGTTREVIRMPAKRILSERFWEKVQKTDGCWEWQAAKDGCGYGFIWVRTRMYRAHRISYEMLHGPIPAGLQIDHLCCNPGCVNPSHLEVVTQAENMRRGVAWEHQRRKTHCPKGHPYDATNTYFNPTTGSRTCRTCHRDWDLRNRKSAKL